jgi:DNA polymerase-3 subunit gamma/tau
VSDIHIKDIHDLIALCEKNNDPMLAADLYANVRVINIQQGQVEFVPLPGSSKDLVTTLSKRLFEWTGKRWMIAVASSGGSPSLAEQRRDTKNEALEKAQQDPALAPWRKAFPNLTLTDITME